MSLFITSLNSGSNGNCYYIGNDKEAVLIDAGISCRETEKRMLRLGLPMENVKAIFISHEHSDHIRGVATLAKKFLLPIYITPPTLKNSGLKINEDQVRSFKADHPVTIGDLSVTPFSKHHDASDPYSFTVEGNGIKIGVITDIGIACARVIHYFKQCDAAFLEANYDEEMLDQGSYPYYLKHRIRGGNGHLSNKQALEVFTKHHPEFMSHLILSHLSKNNNTPELVHDLFMKHAKNTNIIVASRYEESPVYTIVKNNFQKELSVQRANHLAAIQISLFE